MSKYERIGRFFAISIAAIVFLDGCTKPRERDFPGSFEVFFTDPYGQEELLAYALELIRNSQKTIDIASYSFDLSALSDELIEAHQRGIQIRIACEGQNFQSDPNDCFSDMQEAGIFVRPEAHEALMHNKTMVFDSAIVWTGSANFTYNCFYLNNNNVIVIHSPDVAIAYLAEMSQMFSGRFHDEKISDGVERCPVADGGVEVWFSPEDFPQNMLIQRVNDAKATIDFCIYAFTLDDLANALIAAKNRGIVVRGIFDEATLTDNPDEYNALRAAGIDAKEDPCPYAFHHKFIVIDADGDDPMVITGSGNFSYYGTHINDENFIVVHSKTVAQIYKNEFLRWW